MIGLRDYWKDQFNSSLETIKQLNDEISSLKVEVNKLSRFRNAKASMNTTDAHVESWDFWEWSDTIHWKHKWLIAIAVVGLFSLISFHQSSKDEEGWATFFSLLAIWTGGLALIWIFGWYLLWTPVIISIILGAAS